MSFLTLQLLTTVLKWSLLGSVTVSFCGSLALYYYQTSLIYPSNLPPGARTDVPTPDEFGMPNYSEVYLDTLDGERLHSYVILQNKEVARSRPTLMLFHANAGNMGHRLPIAKDFHKTMQCNVFMLSYRGYGKSTGVANEIGIKRDASAALQYVLTHPVMGETMLVAYGQSLGGAVALDLVSKNQGKFSGLIVENTFLSIQKLIPSVFPIAQPISRYLLTQFWLSELSLPKIENVPVLFLSGSLDEIVPTEHMKLLYNLCKAPKAWKEFPSGRHNDTWVQQNYFESIADFLGDLTLKTNQY